MVLDGNLYDQKFLGEASVGGSITTVSDEEVLSCALLNNNKGTPLLASSNGSSDMEGKIILQLRVSTSSRLSGRDSA